MALLGQIRRARQSKDTLHYGKLSIRANCSRTRMAGIRRLKFELGCCQQSVTRLRRSVPKADGQQKRMVMIRKLIVVSKLRIRLF